MPALPRDFSVWALANASLRAGTPVALLCVVSSNGSSPGRQGFKMCVTATTLAGSIGGGIMEHKFIELARQRLQAGDRSPVLRPQIHRREAPADRSGMMCSGEQNVLLWPLTPADLPAVAALENALRTGAPGQWSLGPDTGLQVHLTAPAGLSSLSYEPGLAWRYQEPLGFRDHVTIIGGGNVSLALSNTLALLDFELTVLDDRPNLPTLAANQAAHHRRVVSYDAIASEIALAPQQYVVVMTVGYRTDALVLRQLLSEPAGCEPYRYLGVMGSTAKIAELRRGLAEAGVPTAAIARLRGPIGLPVGSQTPEEIAVSIAAELIQARHGK